MPIELHQSDTGRFYFQYGRRGHKYGFETLIGAQRAYRLATLQTQAIVLSQKQRGTRP